MNKNLYSLGLMSGTSLDGIDASIIKSDGEEHIEVIDNMYTKYDAQLKSELKRIINLCTSKEEFLKLSKDVQKLEREITVFHADLSKRIVKKNKGIKLNLIGFHGQTILHKPQKGFSIQIGDSKLLSKFMKTSVISNFRDNDILNGGQGAPLAPLYHQIILKKTKLKLPLAMVNIGGISNITFVEDENKIISYDTGPGNYLIDKWVKINDVQEFDNNGNLADSGKIDEDILNKFLKDPFYKKKHSKSLDVKDLYLRDVNKLSLEDGSATLSMLTVKSICKAINSSGNNLNAVLFSGGGRKNKFIMNNIKKIVKAKIYLIDDFNFDGDFIESQAFAYLAIRSSFGKFITFPSTTGVKRPCSGGVVFKN